MEIHIRKSPGLRNDLLVVIPRSQIEEVLFHIANRDRLMQQSGLLRHVPKQAPEERRCVNKCKITTEEHLGCLSLDGHALLDTNGKVIYPLVIIGSRNVGNNHGFIAWQKGESPKLFHIRGDPLSYPSYSCLIRYCNADLAIRELRFENQQVFEGNRNISEEVAWCVYANWVLRDGKIIAIEEIIDQFYDIRHVLAFDRERPEGQRIEAEIYQGYPERFRDNALRVLRQTGVPRNRFLHNCLGLSEDSIFILQREGTIEEVAHWLQDAGAKDGVILDNGGSVFCWSWWLHPRGGYLFTAPDFRPNSSAVLAFVLKGSVTINLPSGSVSFSTV